MSPPNLPRYALYAASFPSAVSVAGHTQMGFDIVFPSLSSRLAVNDHGAVSAKIGWLEGNMLYSILGKTKISENELNSALNISILPKKLRLLSVSHSYPLRQVGKIRPH